MRRVYKYPLKQGFASTILELPVPAEILSAGVQSDEIVLWVSFDPDGTETVTTQVIVVPTGTDYDETQGYKFVQTVFISWMVFHIFAREIK